MWSVRLCVVWRGNPLSLIPSRSQPPTWKRTLVLWIVHHEHVSGSWNSVPRKKKTSLFVEFFFLNPLSPPCSAEFQVTLSLRCQEGCHCGAHWGLSLAVGCTSWNQLDFCCGCGPPLGLAGPQAWLCLLSCKVWHRALSMEQNGGAQC